MLTISGLSLTILIFTQVVSRYVFNMPIFGIEELASCIAVWMYFIGCSVGAEQKEHISASLAEMFIKTPKGKRIHSITVSILNAVISGWMTVWAWQLTSWTLKFNMTSTELNIAIGYIQLAMPIGLGLMTFYFLTDLIQKTIGRKQEFE
ncbi:TRAP transporter small permease [Psychromonas aquatilis]|uniref:TRAP transporter small permease protein n=1 Tax=Psychromonas aquatilis TaxID=2005072 RepID=A0ABU9GNF0_9GAMM